MYDESTVESIEEVISSEPVSPKPKKQKQSNSKTPNSGAMKMMKIELITDKNTYCMDGGEGGGDGRMNQILEELNHQETHGNYIWFAKGDFPEGTTAQGFLQDHLFGGDIDEVLKENWYIGKADDVVNRGFTANKSSHSFGSYLDPNSELYKLANPDGLTKADHFCILILTEKMPCNNIEFENFLKTYCKRLNNGKYSSKLDQFSMSNGKTGTKYTKTVDYIKNDPNITVSQCAKIVDFAAKRLSALLLNPSDPKALEAIMEIDNS